MLFCALLCVFQILYSAIFLSSEKICNVVNRNKKGHCTLGSLCAHLALIAFGWEASIRLSPTF